MNVMVHSSPILSHRLMCISSLHSPVAEWRLHVLGIPQLQIFLVCNHEFDPNHIWILPYRKKKISYIFTNWHQTSIWSKKLTFCSHRLSESVFAEITNANWRFDHCNSWLDRSRCLVGRDLLLHSSACQAVTNWQVGGVCWDSKREEEHFSLYLAVEKDDSSANSRLVLPTLWVLQLQVSPIHHKCHNYIS